MMQYRFFKKSIQKKEGKQMRKFNVVSIMTAIMLTIGISMPVVTLSAQTTQSNTGQASGGNTHIIKYVPNMTMQSLAGKPETDVVEFSNGRKLQVGTLHRLQTIAQKMHMPYTPKYHVSLSVLKEHPIATAQTKNITSAGALAAALKGANTDTFRLPSGRVISVEQLKVLQPFIERKLGRSLSAYPLTATSSAKTIVVSKNTAKEEWEAIRLLKDDNTILETTQGTRITLGELRQYIQQHYPTTPSGTKKSTVNTPVQKSSPKLLRQQGGKTK
jgi:hypothetical protein